MSGCALGWVKSEEQRRVISGERLSRGVAKGRAQATIQELARFWTPSPDHKNWAHELAIDLISLWTCGPAYLECFQHFMERTQPNPYRISQDHPPYSLRLQALIDGSRQVGFGDYATGLASSVKGWHRSKTSGGEVNRLGALADSRLTRECIKAAFGFCKSIELVKCRVERLEELRERLANDEVPPLGAGLLLAAWLVYRERGETEYRKWEEKTVYELAARS